MDESSASSSGTPLDNSFEDEPSEILHAIRYAVKHDVVVDSATTARMMAAAPALADASPSRLGEELVEAVESLDNVRVFFDRLIEIGALSHAYPEIAALRGVRAGPKAYHKEGDSYEHTMQVLSEMAAMTESRTALFAALAHDLGKGETPEERLPSHYGHASSGADVAAQMREQLALPDDIGSSMEAGAALHMKLHKMDELNATTVLDMAERLKASGLSAEELIMLGKADRRGREPVQSFETADEATAAIKTALDVLSDIDAETALEKRGYDNDDVGDAIGSEQVTNLVRQDRAEAFRERR